MHQKKSKVLIVDDEVQIRKMLNIFLETAGFNAEESDSGKQALRMTVSVRPDIILLDLGLPDIDGKEVITQIRERSRLPIIVMSVRASDEEIVAALKAGADDYVVKPFNSHVLLARIKANLRKAIVRQGGEPELVNGPIRMDLIRHEVYLDGMKVRITPKEYDLLRCFMINRGRMMSHDQILQEVWGHAHGWDTQYLRVYVGQLREIVEADPSDPRVIVTEPGIGYRMEVLKDEISQAA
ncbi:MAG: response regulator transcription factor [Pseudomonadota bacterium]|nr:response regulator transcription factor [Pseudomonadota bacterium]